MKKTQFGRSMIEMLAVLAIMGILTIGSLLGYQAATHKNKVNVLIKDLLARTSAIQSMSLSRFVHLLEGEGIKLAGFNDTTLNGVNVSTRKSNSSQFIVEYTGLSDEVCQALRLTTVIADTSSECINSTLTFTIFFMGAPGEAVDNGEGQSSENNGSGRNTCSGCTTKNPEGTCIDNNSQCPYCYIGCSKGVCIVEQRDPITGEVLETNNGEDCTTINNTNGICNQGVCVESSIDS